MLTVALGLCGLGALSACSTPAATAPHAQPLTPPAYRHAAAPAPAPLAAAADWRAFKDPTLEALTARAMRDNPGIEAAAARLLAARALLSQAQAAGQPQLSLGAGGNRQGGPLVNAAGASGTLLTASASVSYELDLFGRWAQGREATAMDEQARAAQLQAAQLLVQADVAQTYFALRALDTERATAREGVQAWRDTLALTEQRWRAGSWAEPAVLRVSAELAACLADAANLDGRRAALEHALALLLGEPASSYALPESDWTPAVPRVPAGLPSEMLARRPDVAAARRGVAAAELRSGEARAAWWPTLALTASGGQASASLGDWLRAATRAWGVGALLTQPLLDAGRREAGIRQADAQVQIESAQLRGQVLLAFKEVEDQLGALDSLALQAQHQAQAQDAAVRSRSLAQSRVRQGLASQLELLDAVRGELRSRHQVLQVRAAQVQATVGLIKALGGGWAVEAPG